MYTCCFVFCWFLRSERLIAVINDEAHAALWRMANKRNTDTSVYGDTKNSTYVDSGNGSRICPWSVLYKTRTKYLVGRKLAALRHKK